MGLPGYRRYIKSEAWKQKRRECFRRACGRCEECRAAPAEHAHHLTYERFGDELPEDLRALCVRCHRLTHGHSTRSVGRKRQPKGAEAQARSEIAASARRMDRKRGSVWGFST